MLCRRGDNYFQHAVAIAQCVMIPETKHPITFRLKPSIAFDVARVLGMLSAINLDDETMVMTQEVDDEVADQSLSPETQPIEPMRT